MQRGIDNEIIMYPVKLSLLIDKAILLLTDLGNGPHINTHRYMYGQFLK